MPVYPQPNLGPNSAPWGRSVDKRLNGIESLLSRSDLENVNVNKQQNSTINSMNMQLLAIRTQQQVIVEQQAQIQAQQTTLSTQQAQLNDTVTYLRGLKVSAVTGDTFNTGPIAGNGVFRWLTNPESLSAALTIVVPTGRLMVTYGAAELSMDPKENALQGLLGFDVNGGEPVTFATVYATSGTRFGAPVSRTTPIEVEPGSTVTVRTRCGVWASGASPDSGINFARPWLSVQVIPAA